ncbi:MAG: hypothetical protein QHH10_13500 [Peptococcaceae bacterium]|jgi:hypothetical protein|nr:hypothetical protein [Peptococcaceae bacterium]MDH7526310.1 hypothetical protein [Peptococcaceae bacterium]
MDECFLELLKKRYENYYDIQAPPSFVPFPVDIYAHFYQKSQKYFASKKIQLWRMDHEEHCFVKRYGALTRTDVDDMLAVLKTAAEKLPKPGPDHFKTLITGVFVCENPLSPELLGFINRYKFSKPFKFYLHGWSEIRLLALDRSSRQVICSPAGKDARKFYAGLLASDAAPGNV